MTFTYSPKAKREDPWGSPRHGWLLLDPNHDWVIRSGEVEIIWNDKRKIKQTFSYEYKEGSAHHLIPTKFSLKSGAVTDDGRVNYAREIRSTMDIKEQKLVPESEFTLSAYGLPEPPWLKPKQTRWYLWAALGGILCLASAGILRWFKRRASRVSPTLGG